MGKGRGPDAAGPVPWVPTREQVARAGSLTVPDVLARGLDVVLVGINPGLYTAAVGHHFARPGNRFWRALADGGFTPRVYSAFEDGALLGLGIGVTNVAARASASADELSPEELVRGGRLLLEKLQRYRPRWVAFLGIGAYRAAFSKPRAAVGRQPETLAGARVWVLPNPSGLNAHYTQERLGQLFAELKCAIDGSRPSSRSRSAAGSHGTRKKLSQSV